MKTTEQNSVPGDKVIVIHPGSKTWKFGFAKEPFPKHMTNVIARKNFSEHATVATTIVKQEEEKNKGVISSYRPIFWSWFISPNSWVVSIICDFYF